MTGTTKRAKKPKTAKPKGQTGRPSKYSEAVADLICELIADGVSMRQIAQRDDMPHRATMVRWLADHADFAAKCAHAREFQADLMDEEILDTARKCTPETAQADRVKISAFQWRASKLAPKKYGEKSTVDVNVTDSIAQFIGSLGAGSAAPDHGEVES